MKRGVRETSACRGGDDDLHREADIVGLGPRAYSCQQSYCFKDPELYGAKKNAILALTRCCQAS